MSMGSVDKHQGNGWGRGIFPAFPWLTSGLFLLAYAAFGWSLAEANLAWPLCISLILLIWLFLSFLALPLRAGRSLVAQQIRSEQGILAATLGITILSVLVVLMLVWMSIFAYLCILVSAALIFRLDLQTYGYGDRQTLLALVPGATLGMGLGWVCYHWGAGGI